MDRSAGASAVSERDGRGDGAARGVTFTLAGALAGAKRCAPIAVGGTAIGLVFGVLAGQAGLSAAEATLMSLLVFSGAAQFAVIGIWASPIPVFTVVLTTLVIGLRHLLMGATLHPVFSKLPRLKAYASVFFMADENWALTMAEFRKGNRDAAFLLGGGLLMVVAWTSSTFAGRTLGSFAEDPARWGLDFAFTAVFLALLVGMWRGKGDLLPWVVAALVAVGVHHLMPDQQWHILFGGLAGSLAGAVRRAG